MTRRIVFHIGMPKCGSTYLQTQVFPALENVHYVRKPVTIAADGLDDAAAVVVEMVERAQAPTTLLSNEFYCGHPSRPKSYDLFMDFVDRLAAQRPDLAIGVLVVIRRQADFLASLIRHHVRKGGTLALERFLLDDTLEPVESDKLGRGSVHGRYCDYSRFLALEGRHENVALHMIPLELLSRDGETFVANIARFAGSRWAGPVPRTIVNRGPSAAEFRLHQRLNAVAERRLTHRHGLVGLKHSLHLRLLAARLRAARIAARYRFEPAQPLSSEVRAQVLALYRDSNRRLQDYVDYDLREFGYF